MTEPLFFDTDCLSAFLWVGGQSLLALLYPGRIVIPAEVYAELSAPTVPHLRERIDAMLRDGSAMLERIQSDTEEYKLYRKLTAHPGPGHAVIGRGEAAAIVLARGHGGILASNNLRDIACYVEEFRLQHMTTGDILNDAFRKGLITEQEGNRLWRDMLNKRRRLGHASFSDYLNMQGVRFFKDS